MILTSSFSSVGRTAAAADADDAGSIGSDPSPLRAAPLLPPALPRTGLAVGAAAAAAAADDEAEDHAERPPLAAAALTLALMPATAVDAEGLT